MKCVYCKNKAIGNDAIGFPACKDHLPEADSYVQKYATNKDAITNGVNRWPIEEKNDEI